MGKFGSKKKEFDHLHRDNSRDDLRNYGHDGPSPERKPSRFWAFSRRLLLLTVVSGLLGGGLAWLMAASPLKAKGSGQLPGDRDRILGLIPATLVRPINVLVLGIDKMGQRAPSSSQQAGLGGNSDTMLLLRIDDPRQKVTVLSIPRDTQVRIAGRRAKINAANPQGGIPLAAQTVSKLLGGVAIDRFLRVDTHGLIELVDALGGVEVTIAKPMHYVDQTQKLTIDFQPGTQVLNGQELEEYLRFRHDQWGDIGRVQRQQAVLKSLSGQVLQPWTLFKLPRIFAAIQKNVDTDLSLEELLAVGQTLARIDRKNYDFLMLPGRFSQPSEYRLSYWMTNPAAIAALVNRYFLPSPGEQNSSQQNSSPHHFPRAIDTQTLAIAVANGTQEPGLAAKTVALLKSQGFRKAYITRQAVATGQSLGDQTQIIAQQGNPDAARQVQNALGLGQVQVLSTGDLDSEVTVIVKSDLLPKLQTP